MNRKTYDIVTIGGGLGGSALAKAMAEKGASVLVLESETHFKDRVRGEWLSPWGTAEAKELGVYEAIMESGGNELRWWDMYFGPDLAEHRDLAETTTQRQTATSFYHPAMQEALLQSAADSGAEVLRGARATGLQLNGSPTVHAQVDGRAVDIRARLLVGADGRNSIVRGWADFDVQRDKDQNLIAGLLFEDMSLPLPDTNYDFPNPVIGRACLLFPQGEGKVRVYVVIPVEEELRLSGSKDIPQFIEESIKCGVPSEFYATAKPVGPLATFDGAPVQVKHPFKDGVVLVGDAASHSNPTWGQGLSLTLRDVKTLRDKLLQSEDWTEAGNAYAEAHHRYFGVTHTVESWLTQLFNRVGSEADALREKVLPSWEEDPTRQTDVLFSGPDIEITDLVRRRFFGED